MEETTGYNGFTPSDYAEELYRDAKVNSQRKQRLQRRLDNLAREQQQNLKHQMKQRIFKAGIEYYEARAEYCHYLERVHSRILTEIRCAILHECQKHFLSLCRYRKVTDIICESVSAFILESKSGKFQIKLFSRCLIN